MHRPITRVFAGLLLATTLSTPLVAMADGDLQVNLTAQRVVPAADGRELLQAGNEAKPGDVVEYRATYRNTGTGSVRQVAATLPIPQGMEYLPRTAAPARVMASVDGRTFEPLPLKRRVRLADGREVVRDVPLSEYRYLRWTLGNLGAKSEETVRARVRVTPVLQAANTPVTR